MGELKTPRMMDAVPSISNRTIVAATSVSDTKTNSGIDRTSLIENITNSKINRITDNPFYFFNNMSMTKVIFYNIDKDQTTVDEVMDNAYNFIGPASGFRFDKINGVILYGIQRMELNIDMTDWGVSSDPISGEAYLPPNTFIPYQQSYFSIDYINNSVGREVLFRITGVYPDTFPNGANFYKLSYNLETTVDDINPQVVKEYQYLSNNVGTGNVLMDKDSYDLSNTYSDIVNMLKKYYYELFFQQSTQTFVFRYGYYSYFFYDPYLIKFLMDQRIFATNDSNYIHVCQPAEPPRMLNIDYNHTIFHLLENHSDTASCVCYYDGYALLVEDPMSLLTHRLEPYYMITERDDDGDMIHTPLLEKIPLFDTDMINLLPGYGDKNKNYTSDCPCCSAQDTLTNLPNYKKYYSIIYNFLNNTSITSDQINSILNIHFVPCKELYYTIPILIYIINSVMSDISNNSTPSESTTLSSNENYKDATVSTCLKGCIECNETTNE